MTAPAARLYNGAEKKGGGLMEETRAALVTGGSRGIGRGIALTLARRGYDIALTYHTNEADALSARQAIVEMGRRCFVFQAEMEDLPGAAALPDRAREALGRLDAVVCNAARDRRFSILNVTAEEMAGMTAQLYSAQMLCAGAAARHMVRDKNAGSILFITSIHGQMNCTSDFLYGGMKAAIERSCRSLALELSPYRIRVNCIAPGAVNVRGVPDSALKYPYSDIVPLGRRGTEEDIAEAAAFLLSDGASYITGETLRVDGGLAFPGVPEGWAPPNPVDRGFVRKSYERLMNGEEEENKHE